MPRWEKLGEGAYNKTYYDPKEGLVLKVQKLLPHNHHTNQYDDPARSARIFHLVTGLPAQVVHDPVFGRVWTCPYIKGEQASDADISRALLEIYSRTTRIIVDASTKRNFLKTAEGKVVCVDIGLALQMEIPQEAHIRAGRSRANSNVSLNAWSFLKYDVMRKLEKDYAKGYTLTVNTIKALLFISIHRPDILNVDFLMDNPDGINQLAAAYHSPKELDIKLTQLASLAAVENTMVQESSIIHGRLHTPRAIREATRLLVHERPVNFYTIQASITETLRRYIQSRGSIRDKESFTPSMTTLFFRNTVLTRSKVRATLLLIRDIIEANSYDEITIMLSRMQQDKLLVRARFSSGLATALAKCQVIVNLGRNELVPTASLAAKTLV